MYREENRIWDAIAFLTVITDQAIAEIRGESTWVPCNVRLPEEGEYVQISVKGLYTTDGYLLSDGRWFESRCHAVQNADAIDAWKPMPEPFGSADHKYDVHKEMIKSINRIYGISEEIDRKCGRP